jgi:hypothetical protein
MKIIEVLKTKSEIESIIYFDYNNGLYASFDMGKIFMAI